MIEIDISKDLTTVSDDKINIQYFKTKYAEFIIGSFDKKLCLLHFRYAKTRAIIDNRIKKELNAQFVEQDDEILQKTRMQLDEYFNLKRKEFDIPLLLVGTDFQKSVWEALGRVPYGKISTYAQLAKNIDNKKAVRAVANANRVNPIVIIIPCHRIIGTNGSLTGYSGGLFLKKQLLELEQNFTH